MSVNTEKKGTIIPTQFGNVDTKTFDDKLWADYKFVRMLVQGTLPPHREKDTNMAAQVKKIRTLLASDMGVKVLPDQPTVTEEEAAVNGASKVVESTQGAL